MNEWIKKMWYMYTIEFYSVIKRRNEIISFAGKWMDLENIMFSETSHTHKVKVCKFSLICISKVLFKIEERPVEYRKLPGGRWRGGMGGNW